MRNVTKIILDRLDDEGFLTDLNMWHYLLHQIILGMEDIIEYNPAKFQHFPKYTKNVREGVSVIDIEVCRETCNADRQRAVFEFLLASGCRISEMRNLFYRDVITCEFHITGKGSKVRYRYLNDVLLQ